MRDIKQRFEQDIATHGIEIRHDDGLYRHVVFKRPNTSCMLFSLTTTPGRLIYAGDMGCYVFERTTDMFEFFRAEKHEREPNFQYWHEKLVAIDRHGSEEHSVDRFRENLEEYPTDELSKEELENLEGFIREVVSEFEDQGPQVAYSSVNDFSLDGTMHCRSQFFQDFFEYSDKIYTLHYQWACHAIQWGIRKYDEEKAKKCPNCGSFDVVKTHFDNMKVQFGGHASDSVAGASCDECQKCGHHFGYDTCKPKSP